MQRMPPTIHYSTVLIKMQNKTMNFPFAFNGCDNVYHTGKRTPNEDDQEQDGVKIIWT